jgi:cation transporter-like permease
LTETSTAPLGSRQAHEEAPTADKRARRFLLRLSLVNWGIAVVAWTISAALGIASPASIIVYTVLFVIGLFAVIVAIFAFILEKFAHRPGHVDEVTGEVYVPVSRAPEEKIGPGGRPIL